MRKLIVVVLILCSAFVLSAQSAKVIALKDADAREAREKWDKLQAAQAEWDTFHARIEKAYLTVPQESSEGSNCQGGQGLVRKGWGCGNYRFSEDFKAIVPEEWKPSPQCGNGIFINPALAITN
jgi:hypothetical protein